MSKLTYEDLEVLMEKLKPHLDQFFANMSEEEKYWAWDGVCDFIWTDYDITQPDNAESILTEEA
jgi:hypothetical protein